MGVQHGIDVAAMSGNSVHSVWRRRRKSGESVCNNEHVARWFVVWVDCRFGNHGVPLAPLSSEVLEGLWCPLVVVGGTSFLTRRERG